MNKKTTSICGFVFLCAAASSCAQEHESNNEGQYASDEALVDEFSLGPNAPALRALAAEYPDLEVTFDSQTALPSQLDNVAFESYPQPGFDFDEMGADEAVIEFFEDQQVRAAFGMTDFVQVQVVSTVQDPDFPDETIVQVQQTIGGIPVWGSQAVLPVADRESHFAISTVSAAFQQTPTAMMIDHLDESDAEEIAAVVYQDLLKELDPDHASEEVEESPISELQYFDATTWAETDQGMRLAWLVQYDEYSLFVDAETGELLYYESNLVDARTRKTYDFPTKFVILDENGPRVNPPIPADATSAHDFALIAYEYFNTVHGRDSYDGRGAELKSAVHYRRKCNAKWHLRKKEIRYGPQCVAALDVTVHELMHGVVASAINGLPYKNEQGAVSEFFADFFAVMAERANGSNNWLIGESWPGRSTSDPIRDMADPTKGRFDKSEIFEDGVNDGQPDTYSDLVSPTDLICASIPRADAGCVHFNSGILSKAAYLVSDGGTHRGTTISGIGHEKTERIMYRTLVAGYLNARADLRRTAAAALKACDRLSVNNTYAISSSDCVQLRLAYQSVELL